MFDTLFSLRKMVEVSFSKEFILMSTYFLFTGLEYAFWTGVYGSCLGFTKSFDDSKSLIGLHGVIFGASSLGGGLCVSILGQRIKGIFMPAGLNMSSLDCFPNMHNFMLLLPFSIVKHLNHLYLRAKFVK